MKDYKKEIHIVTLETVGYTREQAERLLSKYTYEDLFHAGVVGNLIEE